MIIRIRTQLRDIPRQDNDFTFPVRVADLPKNIPTDVNPRSARPVGVPYKAMLEALTYPRPANKAPFYDANGGIHTAATALGFYRDGDTIVASIDYDPRENGLYNGGHTYLAIQDARAFESFQADESVKFNVKIGLTREQILHLVEASNATKQVKGYSLAYLRGEFDWLEGILQALGVRNNFRFQEGEEAKAGVLDAIRLLIVASPRFYPTDVRRSELRHGVSYYNSVNKALSTLQSDKSDDVRAAAALIPFLFSLSTKILKESSRLYRSSRDRLYVAEGRKGRSMADKSIPFSKSDNQLEHYLNAGVFLPLIAPVRMFINEDLTLKASQGEIMAVFVRALPELLDRAAKLVSQFGGVDSAGGAEPFWQKLYEIIEENTSASVRRELEANG